MLFPSIWHTFKQAYCKFVGLKYFCNLYNIIVVVHICDNF